MQVYKISLFLIVFLVSACSRNEFDRALLKEGINLSFESKFNLETQSEDPLVLKGKDSSGTRFIKIHIIKVNGQDDLIKHIKNLLKLKMMSYNITAVPYPGQMTTTAKCDAMYSPKLQKGEGFNYLSFFVNQRLTPVICQGEDISYKAGAAFFLTKDNQKVLAVEFYIGKQFGIMDINDFFSNYFNNLQMVEINLL